MLMLRISDLYPGGVFMPWFRSVVCVLFLTTTFQEGGLGLPVMEAYVYYIWGLRLSGL